MLEQFGIPEDYREIVERSVIDRVRRDVEYAQKNRAEKAQEWVNGRKGYNREWQELPAAQQADALFVPMIRAKVMRLLTEMMYAYFSGPKFAKVTPKTIMGLDPFSADVLDQVLNYLLEERMDLHQLMYCAFENMFVDGTCAPKLTWDRITRRGQVIVNKPKTVLVPIDDLLIDPFPREDKDIRFIVHWRKVDLDELWDKQDQGIYRNVEKAEGPASEGPAAQDGIERTQVTGGDVEREPVGIYEYWGRLHLLPTEALMALRRQGRNIPPQDVVVTVCENYNAILRGPVPNDYAAMNPNATPYEKLPFIIGRAIPEKDSYWGESIANLLKGLQEEINTIRNDRRANVRLVLNPRTLVNIESGVNLEQAEQARLGGYIATRDIDNTFREYIPGNVAGAGYQEEEVTRRDTEELTGVTDESQGLGRQGTPETATATVNYLEQSNARMGLYGQNINNSLILPFLRKLATYAIAFIEPEELQAILGTTLPPPPLKEFINQPYDIRVEAGLRATSKSAQIKELSYALQIVPQAASVDPETPVGRAVAKIMEKLLPLLDVHDIADLVGGSSEERGVRRLTEGRQGQQQQQPQRVAGLLGAPEGTRLGHEARQPTMEETPGLI